MYPDAHADVVERLFADSRQGAANVEGVRFQIIVSAWMLVTAERFPRPIRAVRPEGLEDIDCSLDDGGTLMVQVKERKGGKTTWPLSEMVSVIEHAKGGLDNIPSAELLAVTNARPGSGLAVTGLDRSLAETLDEDQLALANEAVAASGLPAEALRRSHLLQLDAAQIVEEGITTLAAIYRIERAVAALLWAQLLSTLTEIAGAQRDRTLANARAIGRAELDLLTQEIQATVNPDALQEPVRDGLIAFADFATASTMRAAEFLLGVDVRPGHIVAGLDLLRPKVNQELFAALARSRGALIRGPSGCGKSALLWRCAFELADRARAVEVLRVAPHDVENITRWVKLLRPTAIAPVLVCGDDLGRPAKDGWPALVRRLGDIPHVLVLGGCREEDFSAALLADGIELVRPTLDLNLAHDIATQLEHREVPLKRAVDEAFAERTDCCSSISLC